MFFGLEEPKLANGVVLVVFFEATELKLANGEGFAVLGAAAVELELPNGVVALPVVLLKLLNGDEAVFCLPPKLLKGDDTLDWLNAKPPNGVDLVEVMVAATSLPSRSSPQLSTRTVSFGNCLESVGIAAILSTTSIPSTTSPNTTCLPSR